MYDKIRDKINNPPEVQTTEQDWNNFQNYRRNRDVASNPKPIWPYWVVGSLLLLLGISNGYWISKDGGHSVENSSHSIDTVYITKYIDSAEKNIADNKSQEQLDIVTAELALINSQYQKLIYTLNDQDTKLSQLQRSKYLLESKYGSLQKQWNTKYAAIKSIKPKKGKFSTENEQLDLLEFDNVVEKRLFNSIVGELPRVVLDPLSFQRVRVYHPSEIITVENKRPFNLLEALTPKTLSINANLGYVFGPSEDGASGFADDLRATTLFSKSFRGYIGLSHVSAQSRIEDNVVGVPYPILPEGDEIEHSDEQLTQFSMNIGLEYLLNNGGRWRPFAGLGYGRVLSNTANYSFEIESSNGNEYYIAPEDKISLGGFDQLIFTLGTDFNLASRFDIRLGVNYAHALQNKYNSNFLLKGGVYYHF